MKLWCRQEIGGGETGHPRDLFSWMVINSLYTTSALGQSMSEADPSRYLSLGQWINNSFSARGFSAHRLVE